MGGLSSGGGRTYALGLVGEIGRGGSRDLKWDFLVKPSLARELTPWTREQAAIQEQPTSSPGRRVLWEQLVLPWHPLTRKADVMYSAANFVPLVWRGPQVLATLNPLHFIPVDLKGGRAASRLRIESWLVRASVKRATKIVAPTEAMANLVAATTGRQAEAIWLGPGLVQRRAERRGERFAFIHRTPWGPHKRLRDILVAVRELAQSNPGAFVVRSGCDPYSEFARQFHESESERALLEDPVIAAHMEFMPFAGPDDEIEGDAALMPSMTESFCFPLAEALALGLPIIAADSPFARELCGDSAFLVEPRNPIALGAAMRKVLRGQVPSTASPELSNRLSWRSHVDRLAEVLRSAVEARTHGKRLISRI